MDKLRTNEDFEADGCTCNDHDVVVNSGTPDEHVELVRELDMRCPIHGSNCPEGERVPYRPGPILF